ncbi:MAG: hypothetical protein QM791_02435 [Ferruginibacter sp.]
MKKSLFVSVIITLIGLDGFSQSTGKTPQAVYAQAGGSSPLVGIHYDRRFSKSPGGAGFTVGFGYYGGFSSAIVSVPVSVNYLFGKEKHFAELAAGATYISLNKDFFESDKSAGGVFGHVNMGYRFQQGNGFFLRAGYSPLFTTSSFMSSAYIGLGYAF